MKKLFLLSLVSTFSVGMFAQAGARWRVFKEILTIQVFWKVLFFGG